MIKILDKPIDQIAKELNISTDRYTHIISYILQMTSEYKDNPVDIMKEIPLNLKGNERHFATIIAGEYFAHLYHIMNEKERAGFTNLVAEGLNINRENIPVMSTHMKDALIKEIEKLSKVPKKENPFMDVIGDIVSSKFTGVEKDYMIFEFVLISATV